MHQASLFTINDHSPFTIHNSQLTTDTHPSPYESNDLRSGLRYKVQTMDGCPSKSAGARKWEKFVTEKCRIPAAIRYPGSGSQRTSFRGPDTTYN